MIDVRENKEIIESILYLNKLNIINKKYTTEELNQLIKSLNLYNPTRQYHIHVNSLLYHLKNVGVNYKAIGDSYILF